MAHMQKQDTNKSPYFIDKNANTNTGLETSEAKSNILAPPKLQVSQQQGHICVNAQQESNKIQSMLATVMTTLEGLTSQMQQLREREDRVDLKLDRIESGVEKRLVIVEQDLEDVQKETHNTKAVVQDLEHSLGFTQDQVQGLCKDMKQVQVKLQYMQRKDHTLEREMKTLKSENLIGINHNIDAITNKPTSFPHTLLTGVSVIVLGK